MKRYEANKYFGFTIANTITNKNLEEPPQQKLVILDEKPQEI